MFYTCKVWTAQLILTLSLTAYLKIFLYPDSISPVGMIFKKSCLYKHLFFLNFLYMMVHYFIPIFSIYCTFSLQIEDIFKKSRHWTVQLTLTIP